ncbi:hypothetical protein SEA_WHACK_31 [Rhodococcus phage Whack]|uniref:Uncharacterized protein n=1 Tax=Rhodococcus phage Whack TaxID=2591132 RepID=A0A515MKE7_9CAUD|nr:hypothetical protein HWC40_gp31 [Rhodococcus phage Whack]QDM57094.1 hypothetical protein SEA_WHACK_31 [Rhodococcus phage Whack]
MTTTVLVDFNDLARGGKVVALKKWADGPVSVGDRVTAFDDIEDLRFDAVVAEENVETGEIYLALNEDAEIATQLVIKVDDDAPGGWETIPREKYAAPEVMQEVWKYLFKKPLAPEGDETRPPVVSHLQSRTPEGFWLRYTLGPDEEWRKQVALKFLATTRHEKITADQILRWGVAEDGKPLVIACLETDTIDSVLEQMTERDSVVVTTSLHDPDKNWMISAVSGLSGHKAAEGVRPMETLSEAGLTAKSTIRDLMAASGVYEALTQRLQSEKKTGDTETNTDVPVLLHGFRISVAS